MRQLSTAAVAVLVVGLIVGGYVSGRSSAQAVSRVLPQMTWPPPPQLMVDRQGTATVNGSSPQTIFDVPSGYWFVLTDLSVPVSNSYAYVFQLGEDDSSVFTTHLDFTTAQWSTDTEITSGGWLYAMGNVRFNSATGIAFRPGSKVQLLNKNVNAFSVTWSLVGYLVPK